MQLPHVFIAFLAREVRFPHGFIAFSLFIFLGVPRWPPRAIFCDFGRPLGAFWTLLGCLERTWSAPWSPLGTILVTMLISWGVLWRSRGYLGIFKSGLPGAPLNHEKPQGF